MIEHSHLRIMLALHENGTLTEAANTLCLSQSALSHQIRHLEKKLGVSLWERVGRNLRLTQAGEALLQVAQQVVPVLTQAEQTLKAYAQGRQGVLRIGVECYPCYEWLTGVIGEFLREMPKVDIDVVNKFQFSGLEGLLNQHIDILVTPDLARNETIHYETLTEYELVFLVSDSHPLANAAHLKPEMLSRETLLTFPVPVERLDIMTRFLSPACVKPAERKEIESTEIMLRLVSLNRGVCVLPEWLADRQAMELRLKKLRIGRQGIHKRLYLAMRNNETDKLYVQRFISVARKTAIRSFQATAQI